MKESKESRNEMKTMFTLYAPDGDILIRTDDADQLLIALAMLEAEAEEDDGEKKDGCCGGCDGCDCDCDEDDEDEDWDETDDDEEDDDEDDEFDLDDFEPRTVELFRITINPEKILKAAAVVGGLVALRKIWKRMKG